MKRGRGRPKNIHTPIKHFSEEERKRAITLFQCVDAISHLNKERSLMTK